MTVVPETAPTNGAAPVAPLPPDGGPTQWLVLSAPILAALATQGERGLGLVLLAWLGGAGVPDGAEYRLVIDAAHLEPAPPRA
jgi:hypothetical protein